MIDPLPNPPTRKTTHAATMSPRLSRLYTWLQSNHVGLTDFSTDACVEREMPKLLKLQTELQQLIATSPAQYLTDLAADLSCIMRRTPAARIASR